MVDLDQVISPTSFSDSTHIVATPTTPVPTSADLLTPLRAHYLKKSLIQLQFRRELLDISAAQSPLGHFGPPFAPPPKDAPSVDTPFLKFIVRQFVLTFPFLAAAPKDFYSQKLQPFVAAVLARNLSSSTVLEDTEDGTDSEQVTRRKLMAKIERNLSMLIGAATHLVEKEEVVRLTQSDLDRLEVLAARRQRRAARQNDSFEVNIVGVRTVVDKGRMRSHVHEEFIVRTKRSRYEDVFVSRRYGDFRTLATELQKAYPDENVGPPPAKDRTYVSVPPTTPTLTRQNTTSSFGAGSDYETHTMNSGNGTVRPSRLTREKNRLTLRSYLHTLLSSSKIASSPVLRSFLLSGPIALTADELEDAHRREEADKVRDDGRKRFAKEIAARVDGLRGAVKSVKGDIMGKDGLTQVFGTIKVTPDIQSLPPNYQAVTEWARISLASTVFHQFVASDNASESFAGLKRLHGLMPYFMLKAALKISNPIGMIRSILDLFLAQPFGGRSLLQRMFTSSLTEEVRALEEQIELVKDKVDDPVMCAKVRQFVYASREIQQLFKADAAAEKLNVLTVVLRSSQEPVLSRMQMHRLARAQRAHNIYLKQRAQLEDSDDDDGPEDEDAWLLEDLKVLTHLYSRLRDREQLIALIFEGFTAELLKDIITIFYSPLAQVYRAASIADSINDLQNFINDLIKTVEKVEELSQEDPHQTVQMFINLIQRHEQSFYYFVHKVHSKGEGLFDSLMRWIELFLTIVRDGLGQPISLEFLLPHTGPERCAILAEIDQVALYHYKLKVIYEDKIRRRFGRVQKRSNGSQLDADAEDEATQALVNGAVGEISFGELVQGDAIDLAAEETDDEDESSEYESSNVSGSTEDDDDSEDSSGERSTSEESAPRQRVPPRKPVPLAQVRPQPPSAQRTPTPSRTPTDPSPTSTATDTAHAPPALPRKRSLSLRTSFSFSSLSLSRHSQDVPPVPPVPQSARSYINTQPQPRTMTPTRFSPSRRMEMAQQQKQQQQSQHSQEQRPPSQQQHNPKPKPKKKADQTLKPPQLHYIPQLLPIFTEMMRPLLRPRQRTNP